jgi:hypothetical protein
LLIIDEFGFDKLERKEVPDALSLLYNADFRNLKVDDTFLKYSMIRPGFLRDLRRARIQVSLAFSPFREFGALLKFGGTF